MPTRKVTVATLAGLKARSEKAVFVTAYDYPTATFADRAGVDMILVGDSADSGRRFRSHDDARAAEHAADWTR